MTVLMASEYDNPNNVIQSYIDGLTPYCELVSGLSNFWNSSLNVDIVHIQWPEELFYWQLFYQSDLQRLEKRLEYWKRSGAKFVVTRHNSIPHRNFYLDTQLFELCYKYADGIIHLGEFSLDEFKTSGIYPNKINALINHPNYLNVPNKITKEIAREKMKLPQDSIIYLSFGVIRLQKEQDDLISAFKKLNVKNKKLIFTNSLYLKKIVSFRASPIKNLLYKFEKFNLRSNNIIIDETRNINNSTIQNYYNAADIVVIPRISQLNSGLLYLAFTFSKIIVGPDISNIGSILRKTGNILYKPGDIDSYVTALYKSSKLLNGEIEFANYEYAVNECNIYIIGREHVELYNKLMIDKIKSKS